VNQFTQNTGQGEQSPKELLLHYELVGNSPAMQNAFRSLKLAIRSDENVLITGESGCGKDAFARTIHKLSDRRTKPYRNKNCAAITEGLVESELFGHAKGSFTGATQDRVGAFEEADEGTLVLNEIGELPLHLQAKLLTVLDEGEFCRVGENRIRFARCRIIAATNRDLPTEIRQGRFRKDLYYRLRCLCIHIPPLRERPEDIPHLVYSILKNCPDPKTIDHEALALLVSHMWDGNVRELENCIGLAVVRSKGLSTIKREHITLHEPISIDSPDSKWARLTIEDYGSVLNFDPAFWTPFLNWALEKVNWNVTLLCRKLRVSKPTIYKLINSCGIKRHPKM